MRSDCPGLRHEWEGAGIYCPRVEGEPEDGDWDRFCKECEDGRDAETDRQIDWARERAFMGGGT